MDISEMKNKSIEELKHEIKDLQKKVSRTVEDVLKRKESDVHKPRLLRKDIARIKTIIRQKEILENASESKEATQEEKNA